MFKEKTDKVKNFGGKLEIIKMIADLKKESNRHSRTEKNIHIVIKKLSGRSEV